MTTTRQLHRSLPAHLIFWGAYLLYRSLVQGVWQEDGFPLTVMLLDLPLKIAVAYALVIGVAKPLLDGDWLRAIAAFAATALIGILLRQALWHALILPRYFPDIEGHPGFFDLADLAMNSASLFPVALVLVFLWIILELTVAPRQSSLNRRATP